MQQRQHRQSKYGPKYNHRVTRIEKGSVISQNNKLNLIRAFMFPIAMYTSETWTIHPWNAGISTDVKDRC